MIDAMIEAGLKISEPIIPDGLFRRIDAADGKRGNSRIFYTTDGEHGFFGDWRDMPEGRAWSRRNKSEFTSEERREYARKMQAARDTKAAEQEKIRAEAREKAGKLWGTAKPAPENHPYLVRKGINPHHARTIGDRLIIPVIDAHNQLHGLQFINPDGSKKFLSGTAIQGNFSVIKGNSQRIIIAEGFATGATIAEATGYTVIIAFNAGNLEPVAAAVREKAKPGTEIIIAADNDRHLEINVGLEHATKAASAIGAGLVVPQFADGEAGTDWNDNGQLHGLDAVQQAFNTVNLPAATRQPEPATGAFTLRPYQADCVAKIEAAMQDGTARILTQLPTAAGKGVILSHLINHFHLLGLTVLFLVHREEILLDVSARISRYGIPHGIIKAGVEPDYSHYVQLASIQTLHNRLKNPWIRNADIVIVDEAHHILAATYLRTLKHFAKKTIIGFTATPCRTDGRGLGDVFDMLIQGAKVEELQAQGYLSPLKYYAPVRPDLSGVKTTGADYNLPQLEEVMTKGELVGKIVPHWQQLAAGRQSVVFATSVKHSLAIVRQFQAAGIKADHLDGSSLPEHRKAVLAKFKSREIQVLCNCQLFGEGIDIPDIQCVILARPTKSLSLYMQMVGRGMRISQGKEDCLILDHAGAVYHHGFIEEIDHWSLEKSTKTVNEKQQERQKSEAEPITCRKCSCVYTRQLQCPSCGNIPQTRQKPEDVEYIDGRLGLIVRKSAKKQEPTREEKAYWYQQLKAVGHERGYSDGWLSHKFREKFHVWPRSLSHLPAARSVSPEVRQWVTSRNIAFAKRRA